MTARRRPTFKPFIFQLLLVGESVILTVIRWPIPQTSKVDNRDSTSAVYGYDQESIIRCQRSAVSDEIG